MTAAKKSPASRAEELRRSLEHHNYNERFSGLECEWYMGFYNQNGWNLIYSMSWYIKSCKWRDNQFRFELTGSTGMYPRAGHRRRPVVDLTLRAKLLESCANAFGHFSDLAEDHDPRAAV